MKLSHFLLALLTCLALTTPTFSRIVTRRSSHSKHRPNQGNNHTQHVTLNPDGIYMPGDSYRTLATSYDWRTDGKDGGACGYTIGGGLSLPDAIRGAAQQIEYFGNGLACGTCIKVTPTDISVKVHAEPQIVHGEWGESLA
jgi:hypothetical protein